MTRDHPSVSHQFPISVSGLFNQVATRAPPDRPSSSRQTRSPSWARSRPPKSAAFSSRSPRRGVTYCTATRRPRRCTRLRGSSNPLSAAEHDPTGRREWRRAPNGRACHYAVAEAQACSKVPVRSRSKMSSGHQRRRPRRPVMTATPPISRSAYPRAIMTTNSSDYRQYSARAVIYVRGTARPPSTSSYITSSSTTVAAREPTRRSTR